MIISQVRSLARNIALDYLSRKSLPADGIHILNGHMASKFHPNTDLFHLVLEELSKVVTLIDFDEASFLISKRKIVNHPLVAFSFDDGFEEHHSIIAKVLDDFRVKGCFFINPGFIESNQSYIDNFTYNVTKSPGKMPMNWSQVKDLHTSGHIIGAHTLDHFCVSDGDFSEVKFQISESKIILEDKLEYNCSYFAYPFGRIEHANQESIDFAFELFEYVFTQSNYKEYFSFEGKAINRRHFEPYWPINHIKYFLSHEKKY